MAVHWGGRGPGHLSRWSKAVTTLTLTPTLDLTLTSALPGTVTFTRASSGTYVNSSGLIASATTDAARFDHDPVTLAAKGLLIEEARTNSLTYSEDWSNATWGTVSATKTSNSTTAPDGATTADTLTDAAASSRHIVYNSATLTAATYTYSIFAKKGTGRYIYARFDNASTSYGAVVDLNTGSITQNKSVGSPTNTGSSSTDYGSGFYRASVSQTGSTGTCYTVLGGSDSGTPTYDGNGDPIYSGTSSTWYAWGAQIELGAFPTSYIPTTNSTVTRAADNATMTGTAFSDWWSATADTIVVYADSPASGTRIIWQADDGTANNRITIYTSGTDCKADIVTGGVTQASLTLGTITANTAFKAAIAFAANDVAGCLNGGTVQTDVSASLPTVDRCKIGADTTGNYLCGHISAIKAYNSRVSDATMQSLTA